MRAQFRNPDFERVVRKKWYGTRGSYFVFCSHLLSQNVGLVIFQHFGQVRRTNFLDLVSKWSKNTRGSLAVPRPKDWQQWGYHTFKEKFNYWHQVLVAKRLN